MLLYQYRTFRGSSSIYNVTTKDMWYTWMEDVFTKSAFWEPNYLDIRLVLSVT